MESKLLVKLKNAPRDTSLVPCSASESLNREETLSMACGSIKNKLANNLGEENPPLQRERHLSRLDVNGLVLNMCGQPRMPTSPQKTKQIAIPPSDESAGLPCDEK